MASVELTVEYEMETAKMGVTERASMQGTNGLKLGSENQIQVEFPHKECVSGVERCWGLCVCHQRQPVPFCLSGYLCVCVGWLFLAKNCWLSFSKVYLY